MSTAKPTAAFQYYGMSLWEIEVLYDTLKRSFQVEERQLQPDDPQYVSMIEIIFPMPYDELFFQTFTLESWFKVKGVIKDVKRRRGRKGLKAFIRFEGTSGKTPAVIFPLLSKADRQFEMAIEKIEYLADVVPVQIKSVPPGSKEIWFSFDEPSYKWGPSVARGSNDTNYIFRQSEWKTK